MRLITVLIAFLRLLPAAAPSLEACVATGSPVSVVLKNVNGVAAVAYNLVVEVPAVGKKKASSEWYSWDSLFDGAEGIRLEPGRERPVESKLKPRAVPVARTAVLYEDGAAAGDPDDVRRLLDVRQATQSDMPNVRMLIRNSSDVGALRLDLEKLRKRNMKPPVPVVKRGSSKEAKRQAKDTVRLHYAGSRLPAVVVKWLDETSDKTELMGRLDRLEAEIARSPK